VAIIAPFGSGKTTFLKSLKNVFDKFYPTFAIFNTDHICIEQSIELYPGRKDLDDFIQSRILDNDATTIINAFKKPISGPSLFIADSSYHEHYCYFTTLRKEERLKSHHITRLMFKFKTIRDSLPNPDMFIYIDRSVDDILQNIKERKRNYELSNPNIIRHITFLKQKYNNLFLTNRNYRYDRHLLANMFVYNPESSSNNSNRNSQQDWLEIENHIKAKMEQISLLELTNKLTDRREER
jgi:deoxyadenosine/deoxycytidine kinase